MTEEPTITDEQLQGLTQDQLMALYVEQLIIDKGLEATDELRAELSERIDDKVNTMVLENLPDEALEKLNQSFEDGSATNESVMQLVEDSGVDMEKIVEDAMEEFRDEYLKEEQSHGE